MRPAAVSPVGSGAEGVRVVFAVTGGEVVMGSGSMVGVRACEMGRLGYSRPHTHESLPTLGESLKGQVAR